MDEDEILSEFSQLYEDRPDKISTGSVGLDLILQGGFARGKLVELFGEPGTGKTTLALATVSAAQKFGPVVWVDPSGCFDRDRAAATGINVDDLLVIRPDDASFALHAVRVASRQSPLIVFDAVTEVSMEINDQQWYETQFSMLAGDLSAGSATALCISSEVVSDYLNEYMARSLRGHANTRVKLSSKRKTNSIAYVTAEVFRDFASPPSDPVKFKIRHGIIDHPTELVTLALENGILTKNGAWIYFGERQLGQGISSAVKYATEEDLLSMESSLRNLI